MDVEMPWTKADVDRHKKGLTDKQKETWVEVANSALKRCVGKGGSQEKCEGSAIRQANSVVGQQKESGMEYKAYTTSTNSVLISINAVDVGGEAVPVAELVAAYEEQQADNGDLQEATTKTVDGKSYPASDFLVMGDPEKPSTWHLPVKRNGKPNHRLMGAAKAALTVGYRGNKYEGPDKQKAISKLKALYRSEDMAWDGETSEADIDKVRELLEQALAALGDQQEMAEVELSESAVGHAVGLAEAQESIDAGPRAPLMLNVALIEPGWGNEKDKHYYPREMLERDAHVFEGVKMYATDHRPEEKSVRTEVAVIKTCPVAFTDDGAPIALAAIHDGDFAEQTRNRAQLGTLDTLECSILAMGRTKKGEVDGKEANIVEAITKGQSVDWVTKAGAGGHALNLAESNIGGVKMDKEQIEKLLSESELPQEVQERLAGAEYEDEEAVKQAILKEQKQAQEEEAPQKLAEAEVAQLLSETNLPSASKNRLAGAEYEDESALREAILAEVEYVKTLTGSGQPFGQGQGQAQQEIKPLSERLDAIDQRYGLQVPQGQEV
jgi:hypothetical protein